MNPKVVKLKAEREKNDAKILSLQSRNEKIDADIIEIENTDIIGMVREMHLSPDDLMALLAHHKQHPSPGTFEPTSESTEGEPYEN